MEARANNYCVYKHTTPSGKVYIGITSKPVEKRWLNGRGYRRNEHFWNAIQKYGWDNIEHTVLASGLSKEEASEVEKMYISLFRSHEIKHGYNLTEGGETGIVHTMESRRKLSESRKGQRYNIGVPFTEERKRRLSENHADVSGENNPMWGKKKPLEEIARRQAHREYSRGAEHPGAKPILQLDMDGNIVKRWDCIKDAAEHFCRTSIKDCLKGKYKQHRGYQWRYADEN